MLANNERLIRALNHANPRWAAISERVELKKGTALAVSIKAPQSAYMIIDGLVSLRYEVTDTPEAAVALLGRNNLVNAMALVTEDGLPFTPIVEIDTISMRVPTKQARAIVDECPASRKIVQRCIQELMAEQAFGLITSTQNELRQRVAILLIKISDLLGSNPLFFTQDDLGSIAGIRRPSITEVLNAFEAERLIKKARGRIEILNEEALMMEAGPALVNFKRVQANMSIWLHQTRRPNLRSVS